MIQFQLIVMMRGSKLSEMRLYLVIISTRSCFEVPEDVLLVVTEYTNWLLVERHLHVRELVSI